MQKVFQRWVAGSFVSNQPSGLAKSYQKLSAVRLNAQRREQERERSNARCSIAVEVAKHSAKPSYLAINNPARRTPDLRMSRIVRLF